LDQDISVDQYFSNMAWMIATNFIVFNTFIFAVVLFIQMSNKLFECIVLLFFILIITLDSDFFNLFIFMLDIRIRV